MSTPHRDCGVQTSPSMTGLRNIINDAANLNPEGSPSVSTRSPCSYRQPESHMEGEKDVQFPSKSSAAQRHFSKYEPQQLQQVNSDIELGWDCGICLETAEDPCVTRCGHLYCQSHLNHWLSTHPSCPVCKALCTPAQDVVPIFSRGRTSPTPSPISTTPPSSALSDQLYYNHHPTSPLPYNCSESPTPTSTRGPWSGVTELDSLMSDYDIMSEDIPYPQPLAPDPASLSQTQLHPHPLMTSHLLAHYLGIALRIVGVGILLGVLLR